MTIEKIFQANRQALEEATTAGLTHVDVDRLQELFDMVEKQVQQELVQDAHPVNLEKFRADLQGSLAYQEHRNSWSLEGFKQIIALGQSTLKSIMLINGGASVALLAFLGNIVNSPASKTPILPFANSLGAFVIGVFLAALAYALTYFSQLFYDGEQKWKQTTGLGLHVATSVVGAAAMIAFLCGAHAAYRGFISIGP
ncbi:uncharacterized membrane protein YidH (DUF202 family) [Xanthomonas translucens]